jgi:hypothetical protein
MIKNDSKLDSDWLRIIAGDIIMKMEPKLRLQARLIRAALVKQKNKIESSIPEHDQKFHKRLEIALIQEGLLESKSRIKIMIDNKIKALIIITLGAGVVWATQVEPHFTKPMIAGHVIIQTKNVDKQQESFWRNNFIRGSFTGFWSRLNNYVDQDSSKTKFTLDNSCRPKLLTLKGCTKLALKFDSAAQFNLGLMYEQGINVNKNYESAMEWYKKSAALGNIKAKFNMNYLADKKLVK